MKIEVDAEGAGARLDRFLAARFPNLSRALLMKYVKEGHARVNGRRARPGVFVAAGDDVELRDFEKAIRRIRKGKPQGQPTVTPTGQPRDVVLLHEDEHFLAVNKPAGLVMHPGKGHEEEGLDLVLREAFGQSVRLVHRIDRDTSGVVVAARGHPVSARRLTEAFREGDVEKRYLALVRGRMPEARGVIDARLVDTKREGERVHVDDHGKEARTRWRVLEEFRDFSWVELFPETGRRHQIRAHLAHAGRPLAVDKTYAHKKKLRLRDLRPDLERSWKNPVVLQRQPLHASKITLRHPATGAELTLSAPLPPDLQEALKILRAGAGPKAQGR